MNYGFTTPFTPPTSQTRDPRPRSDDGTKVWDDRGGPAGTGAWVPANDSAPREPGRTFDPLAYGGRGQDIDANGNPVAGTSGAERDISRFDEMAAPTNVDGPTIDQTRGNESRGIGMEAAGLLKETAEGTSPSAAERFGTRQGQAAQDAQHGIAASVRGGAGARAAAARGAVSNAGTIGQQTLASNAATRAGEMANARGAYFGATSGIRGQDLNVASEKGNLDVGQRNLNDAREQFYENLGQDLRKDEVTGGLRDASRSFKTTNAARDARTADFENDSANKEAVYSGTLKVIRGAAKAGSDEKMKTNVSGVTSNATKRLRDRTKDVAQADPFASRSGIPGDPLDGNVDPKPGPGYGGPRGTLTDQDTGSLGGFRREVGVTGGTSRLVSDLEAARLKKQGEDMIRQTEDLRQASGLSTSRTPGNESAERGEAEEAPKNPRARVRERMSEVAGKPADSRATVAQSPLDKPGGSEELQAAIRESVEKDKRSKTLFGNGERGYASGRAGELGGMFGEHLAGAPTIREENRVAPGTRDFFESGEGPNVDASGSPTDPYSQQIMMSDERTKKPSLAERATSAVDKITEAPSKLVTPARREGQQQPQAHDVEVEGRPGRHACGIMG